MHRTNGAGNVSNLYVSEDAMIGRPPTELTAQALNAFQEELVNIATMNGGLLNPPNGDTYYQCRDAIIAYVAAQIAAVGGGGGATVAFATAAEAQAMVATDKAISPAMLAAAFGGSNQDFVAEGYQKLPGGLILQFGAFSLAGASGNQSSLAVLFPLAFPNECKCVIPIGSNQYAYGYSAASVTSSGFTVKQQLAYFHATSGATGASGSDALKYIAIGR